MKNMTERKPDNRWCTDDKYATLVFYLSPSLPLIVKMHWLNLNGGLISGAYHVGMGVGFSFIRIYKIGVFRNRNFRLFFSPSCFCACVAERWGGETGLLEREASVQNWGLYHVSPHSGIKVTGKLACCNYFYACSMPLVANVLLLSRPGFPPIIGSSSS